MRTASKKVQDSKPEVNQGKTMSFNINFNNIIGFVLNIKNNHVQNVRMGCETIQFDYRFVQCLEDDIWKFKQYHAVSLCVL